MAARRKYDPVPLVIISPKARAKIGPVAFGGTDAHIQQDFVVRVVLIQDTGMDNETVIADTTFLEDMKNLFMVVAFRAYPTGLPAGVRQVKVYDTEEYKGNLLMQTYAGTGINIAFSNYA
jgi:hypothetical protein